MKIWSTIRSLLCLSIAIILLERNLVMLVDDENDIISLFTEFLTKNGIKVRPFTNPEEALKDFSQNHEAYSLIISDIRMSPISGVEFIKRLREIDSRIKVILMTAFEIDGNQLTEVDTDEFFNKPIKMNELVQIVKKYVS